MEKFSTSIAVTVVVIIGVVGLSWSGWLAGPCEQPVTYRIGDIDPQFNIASSTVRKLLTQAETVWEEPIDKELFVYDPEADFEVNFIFDERQQATEAVNSYEAILSDLEASHEEIISAHERATEEYEKLLAEYNERKDQYDADLADYNKQVSRWNDRGGAPDGVHQDLMNERKRLNDELAILQQEQNKLETMRENVNKLASRGNSLAEEYNETAVTFSDQFGESHEFNQATYVGDAINVYQFEQLSDLRLALTHELGHALGIEHVKSAESVMYYLMEDQQLNDISLSDEDMAALNGICNTNDA